ncbi:MAG: folate family ECF transporter S component [Clostridiales bacterium]|jgi:ECF transporter S component (folate family)|nr:folate family ECF transporter S component [Clostridiales bacterium]
MYKLTVSQKIAFSAVLAAICVVVKVFKFTALPGLEISFSYTPNFLAGIFLGPMYGGLVGLVGDLIGTLIQGKAISPLITLGNTLIGALMGIAFRYAYINNVYMKIVFGAFMVLIVVTYGINTVALVLPPLSLYSSYMIALSVRIPQATMLALNTLIVIGLYEVLDRTIFMPYKEEKKKRPGSSDTKKYEIRRK